MIAVVKSPNAARERVIRQLLERWHELTDPVRSGNEGGAGSGVMVMPHERGCLVLKTAPPRCSCARRDLVELERLLRAMREDRSAPLLVLPRSGEKVSVRACGWHVLERYVRSSSVTRLVRFQVRNKHGKRVWDEQWRVVEVFDRGVRTPLVDRGIAWLADAWTLGHEPGLPAELRRVA